MFIPHPDLMDDEVLEADVCIIGSGPAGLTMARELDGHPARVVVIEGGGLEFDAADQALSEGPSGEPAAPYSLRRRQFGGTANCWGIEIGDGVEGVRCVPLDEVDFEPRWRMRHGGWPFPRSHLDPFYDRAGRLLHLGPFDLEHWADAGHPPLDLGDGPVASAMVQFSPRDVFLREVRGQLAASENVRILVHANAVEIESDPGGRFATGVRCATLGHRRFSVKARSFVLAAGGIENPRLLLLSNRQAGRGLGNRHDLVGRYFMDHYGVFGGVLFPRDRTIFDRAGLYDIRTVAGAAGMGMLVLTQDTLRREGLLNTQTYLIPRHRTYHWQRRAHYSRRYLQARIARRRPAGQPPRPRGVLENLRRCSLGYLVHAPHWLHRKLTVGKPFFHAWWTCKGGWSRLPDTSREFSIFEVAQLFEQEPDPENRVLLSDELDRLGCRKIRVRRRLTAYDVASVRRTQQILREEFARRGLGRFAIDEDFATPEFTSIDDGASHHMGTTRMHDDPRQGVVDADCRVHGIANLYVAGSSVFPTGGHANPTLTIVALALRLSDHLKVRLRSSCQSPVASCP